MAAHDEVNVAIVGGLVDQPRACLGLQPQALPVENPAGVGVKGPETRMRRKRAEGHRFRPCLLGQTVTDLRRYVKGVNSPGRRRPRSARLSFSLGRVSAAAMTLQP